VDRFLPPKLLAFLAYGVMNSTLVLWLSSILAMTTGTPADLSWRGLP